MGNSFKSYDADEPASKRTKRRDVQLQGEMWQKREVKYPDSKVHGAHMGPIWGRQDPGGLHVGPMNFAIWVSKYSQSTYSICGIVQNSFFGLLPVRRQAIIWTTADRLLIGTLAQCSH